MDDNKQIIKSVVKNTCIHARCESLFSLVIFQRSFHTELLLSHLLFPPWTHYCMIKQENIPVGCVTPTCQLYVLFWLPLGVSTRGGGEYPKSHVQGWGVGIHMPSGIPDFPLVYLSLLAHPSLVHLPALCLVHPPALWYTHATLWYSPGMPPPHTHIPLPRRDLGPGIPTHPLKGPETRHHNRPSPPPNRHTLRKTFPQLRWRAVIN